MLTAKSARRNAISFSPAAGKINTHTTATRQAHAIPFLPPRHCLPTNHSVDLVQVGHAAHPTSDGIPDQRAVAAFPWPYLFLLPVAGTLVAPPQRQTALHLPITRDLGCNFFCRNIVRVGSYI